MFITSVNSKDFEMFSNWSKRYFLNKGIIYIGNVFPIIRRENRALKEHERWEMEIGNDNEIKN